MKKYKIYAGESITYTTCIEANSKKEAEELAYKKIEEEGIDTWDISPTPDSTEVTEVEEYIED